MSVPVVVLKGSDPVLLDRAVSDCVDALLGGGDHAELVDQFDGDEYECGALVMAANSVSMFGDRIVVGRNAARFGVDDLAPLLTYLQDPSPSATVVVAWEKPLNPRISAKTFPKKLSDAVKAAGGEVRDSDPPGQTKQRAAWLDARLGEAAVSFTAAARRRIADHVGEDVGRIGGLVAVLDGSFPSGTKLDAEDVEPFLGDEGSVPPWDLTDAIDGGDVATAVDRVQRMVNGGRHPLQLMATLQTHYERILRLDGADVRNENEAAALLGMKGSTYPAKKALATSRRLGHDGVSRAIRLLAQADVDLRGASAWPAELVVEVLVGRLARLSPRR
jgi:DNA polymerase-3 subunit delta